MRKIPLLVVLIGVVGCGSSSGGGGGTMGPPSPPPAPTVSADGVPLLAGFNPGAPPDAAAGFQIVLPIVDNIEPQSSTEYCSWTNKVLDKDVDVKASEGFQSATGHHVILFYTQTPLPPGTQRVCADSDMATFRFTMGVAGEGTKGGLNKMPGDLVAHIPKGSQIVINHHYLNPGTETVRAQSALNVLYNTDSGPTVRAGAVAWLDTSLNIPPGAYTMHVNCTMKNDLAFWRLIPHMHNWGQHIAIDHTSGGQTTRLFDVQWDPDYAFHPPEIDKDPASPYMMKSGDTFAMACDYNNNTGKPLTFGAEMCVAFGQTIDTAGVGNVACDAGYWVAF